MIITKVFTGLLTAAITLSAGVLMRETKKVYRRDY
jgi:hypothetical protein